MARDGDSRPFGLFASTLTDIAIGAIAATPRHVTCAAIVRNITLQVGYVLVFGSAAWARFTTRDVLA
jgi:hypothetical protein